MGVMNSWIVGMVGFSVLLLVVMLVVLGLCLG